MAEQNITTDPNAKIAVLHLLDPAGGSAHLWGKERMVLWLMQAQKEAGAIEPMLATLSQSSLNELAEKEGIRSTVLRAPGKFSREVLQGIRKLAVDVPGVLLHTHGYKANILGRLAARRKSKFGGLVSTCHGWVENDWKLRAYNRIDRWTSSWSDAVTVPDPNMLGRLGPSAKAILNGIPDSLPPTREERLTARAKFGFTDRQFAAGMLGRLSPEKGIAEFLEAAKLCADPDILWVVAGMGPLEDAVRNCDLPNVRFVGYVDPARNYLAALDAYVQPSRTEGLSLSLLEAASAKLAIVATKVGATEHVIRNEQEGILIEAKVPQQLVDGVTRLKRSSELAMRFAGAARERFESEFRMSVVQQRYHELYRRVIADKRI